MARQRLTPQQIFTAQLERIRELARQEHRINDTDARELIETVGLAFKYHLESNGIPESAVRQIRTKFRDAGRRSAPWRPTSSRVPGRPQDGSDGNRINRWLLPADHKFYATEVEATLVEVKYYLQAWSMTNAPALPPNSLQDCFVWLVGHRVAPGEYKDPVQLCPIDLTSFVNDRRLVQSGHLRPLDRDGKHVPSNTFLMLARSNQLQGNLTLDELIGLMRTIVVQHQVAGDVSPVAITSDQSVKSVTSTD